MAQALAAVEELGFPSIIRPSFTSGRATNLPQAFPRVYVQLNEPLTVQGWLRGLVAGRTFITNGPLLELQAGKHAHIHALTDGFALQKSRAA